MVIKVTIKDKDALLSITREQMTKYAEKFGWVEKEIVKHHIQESKDVYREIGIKYSKYSTVTHKEYYIVAIDEDNITYSSKMSENLMNIEQCDNISQLQAFCDITETDIIVLHLDPSIGEDDDDQIPV